VALSAIGAVRTIGFVSAIFCFAWRCLSCRQTGQKTAPPINVRRCALARMKAQRPAFLSGPRGKYFYFSIFGDARRA